MVAGYVAAVSTIASRRSITPTSANTQAWSAAIGVLNILSNASRLICATLPVRYADSELIRDGEIDFSLRSGSNSISAI